jgi:thioredoxin-like negative regulator of GroEL
MVDVDENQETMAHCGVSAMPSFILYKNGSEVDKMQGGSSPDKLKAMISKHV